MDAFKLENFSHIRQIRSSGSSSINNRHRLHAHTNEFPNPTLSRFEKKYKVSFSLLSCLSISFFPRLLVLIVIILTPMHFYDSQIVCFSVFVDVHFSGCFLVCLSHRSARAKSSLLSSRSSRMQCRLEQRARREIRGLSTKNKVGDIVVCEFVNLQ